jgi:hypothetical protein
LAHKELRLIRLLPLVMAVFLLAGACTATAAGPGPAPAAPPASAAPADTAVLTQKGDPARSGWNRHETVLTQADVNPADFGRRTTYPVDGAIYAQPLFVPGLSVAGGTHNVVVVATEHDSVYAFDADATGPAHAPLWHRALLPPGARSVSAANDITCAAISPEVGITGTPVIDPATHTLYVVATTKDSNGVAFRLYAVDLRTGADRVPPVRITASVPGTAPDAVHGTVSFDPRYEQQRMGLLLLGGVVYVAFASYCDQDPSHGWILGYRATDLRRSVVYNDSPNKSPGAKRPGGSGLWESETGLTADSAGSIYVVSGNGPFDLDTGGANAGNSLLRFVPDGGTLRLADYFAPFHQSCLNDHDQDLGSGAPLLLPQSGEVLFVGKEGRIYLTRADHLGGNQPLTMPCAQARETVSVDRIVQELPNDTVQGGVWGSETYWTDGAQTYLYTAGVADHLRAWRLTGGTLATPSVGQASSALAYPGGVPVLSSAGDTAGTAILWIVSMGSGPALRAYDPANLGHELYASDRVKQRDGLTGYANFTVPTVAAGRVFVGTKSSLVVYGPLR